MEEAGFSLVIKFSSAKPTLNARRFPGNNNSRLERKWQLDT